LFLGEQGALAALGLLLGALGGACTAWAQPTGVAFETLGPLSLWLLLAAFSAFVWVALGAWIGLRGAPREALARE
jgi:hypothetical protein